MKIGYARVSTTGQNLDMQVSAHFMPYTTYCTRFDNKDKTPRLFPFLQPYEVAYKDAEYIYNNSKKYGRTNKS